MAVTNLHEMTPGSEPLQVSLVLPSAPPFSKHGFHVLQEAISHYIEELVDESIKVSRRNRADDVSATHIEQASHYLIARPHNHVLRHLGTLGGVVLGAGLASVLTYASSAIPIPFSAFLISIAFTAVGAFLVAVHMARE